MGHHSRQGFRADNHQIRLTQTGFWFLHVLSVLTRTHSLTYLSLNIEYLRLQLKITAVTPRDWHILRAYSDVYRDLSLQQGCRSAECASLDLTSVPNSAFLYTYLTTRRFSEY
jgi:hypothetical protein